MTATDGGITMTVTSDRVDAVRRRDHGDDRHADFAFGRDQLIVRLRADADRGASRSTGVDLPTVVHVRSFAQLTVTLPLYRLWDVYYSSDSPIYVVGIEGALGVRF